MPATTTRLPTPTNAVGILCALGAWFLFSLNDAGIKLLSDEYALHQIVLIRSVVALIITLTILMPVEGGYSLIKTKHPFIHMVRGTLDCSVCWHVGRHHHAASRSGYIPLRCPVAFVLSLCLRLYANSYKKTRLKRKSFHTGFLYSTNVCGCFICIRATVWSWQIR